MKTTVTFEDKKKKAIELMEKLDIHKPYIRGFKQDNTICYFEQYAGFWAYQDEELMKKIKEFEERTGKCPFNLYRPIHAQLYAIFRSYVCSTCLSQLHHIHGHAY